MSSSGKRRYFLTQDETDEMVDRAKTEIDQRALILRSERILQQHRDNLSLRFSLEEINQARKRLSNDLRTVRRVFAGAGGQGSSTLSDARELVTNVMTSGANVGAIATLAKLKKADEASFLHSLSVSALMIAFGRAIKLAEPVVHELAVGGLLHDIGKIAIPVSILRKSGRLTESEIAIIQRHPVYGFELLRKHSHVSTEILDIALLHHERYDGTGYPKGLKGVETPFNARLAAVCDVYDALTSIRPYKRAFSQAEALSIMIDAKGHLDPELLEAFIDHIIEPEAVV